MPVPARPVFPLRKPGPACRSHGPCRPLEVTAHADSVYLGTDNADQVKSEATVKDIPRHNNFVTPGISKLSFGGHQKLGLFSTVNILDILHNALKYLSPG